MKLVAKNRELEEEEASRRIRSEEQMEATLDALLPKLRGRLYRLLGPGAELDDVLQDTLVELAKALPRFEGRSSVETFAHKILLRTAYRHLRGRKQRNEVTLELVPSPPDARDPESRAIHREALRRLYRCLDRMPEKRRIAFILCAVEGLSPSEAAELEGVPSLVMRARLMNARTELESRLGQDAMLATFFDTRRKP